ncbi:MAG TPA: MBL fold metallo-hydrolase, partial [Firmicutes bacterium]|nr:MBL fold metallo-hydrolase [Bacillota bacterium]
MIKLHCIASGSKGNAVIIFNNDTTILIDCGITRSRLIEGLNEINKTIDDINFALFTHDH